MPPASIDKRSARTRIPRFVPRFIDSRYPHVAISMVQLLVHGEDAIRYIGPWVREKIS